VVDGLLYAVGGHDGPLVKKSAEVYNPTTNCWAPISEMNMSRRNAGLYCLCLSLFITISLSAVIIKSNRLVLIYMLQNMVLRLNTKAGIFAWKHS